MNKQECKAALDAVVGLPSTMVALNDEAVLKYYSPIGTLLFELHIGDFDGHWQFGGTSSALLGSWKILCQATRLEEKSK